MVTEQAMTGPETPPAHPRACLECTDTEGTFLSSHSSRRLNEAQWFLGEVGVCEGVGLRIYSSLSHVRDSMGLITPQGVQPRSEPELTLPWARSHTTPEEWKWPSTYLFPFLWRFRMSIAPSGINSYI